MLVDVDRKIARANRQTTTIGFFVKTSDRNTQLLLLGGKSSFYALSYSCNDAVMMHSATAVMIITK